MPQIGDMSRVLSDSPFAGRRRETSAPIVHEGPKAFVLWRLMLAIVSFRQSR